MSQNTQTTAYRIISYLRAALDLAPVGPDDPPTALSVAGSVIAAELDSLRRERDECAEQYRASVAERVALREQLNNVATAVLRIPWGLNMVFDPMNLAAGIQARVDAGKAEIDALTAERDAMKLEVALMRQAVDRAGKVVAELETRVAEARQLQYKEHDRVVELRKELNGARAEIERLRLKAHAWDTHRHAMFLTSEQDAALLKHEFECEDAFIASWEAEAKERGISPYKISGYTDMKTDQAERMMEGYYTAMEDAVARAAKVAP